MHHFTYQNGVLHAEEVSIAELAETVGTPFYCYSTATLQRHYTVFREAFGDHDIGIHYAMKANSNMAVIRTLAQMGAGADVVSAGEIHIALRAGIDPAHIVFSGVGKTDEDFKTALTVGVGQINVESEPELKRLSEVATAMGATARIALRVNPDVAAKTHEKITTGRKEDKFGIEWTEAHRVYKLAQSLPGIEPMAIAVHIGSQITDLAPFEAAFLRVRDLYGMLQADGFEIKTLDLGGGLGIPYDHGSGAPPSPEDYAKMVLGVLGQLDCKLAFEPGRVIAGNAGVLVTRVIFEKHGTAKRFVIVDAGMNDLLRPAMYGASHEVIPVNEQAGASAPADLVGPVCETGDRFAQDISLPESKPGDLFALLTAGAYGAVMANSYNARPLVPEILVNGTDYAVVRRRPSLDDMLSLEQTPDWQDA